MRISDWSSDVCSSDLRRRRGRRRRRDLELRHVVGADLAQMTQVAPGWNRFAGVSRPVAAAVLAVLALLMAWGAAGGVGRNHVAVARSEEHTSELQSLMRISYAVFCLKKKKKQHKQE